MRRILAFLVLLSVLFVPALAQAEKPIGLFVGGVEVQSDVPPVLESGRTLVPLRALTEALGFAVNWDEATQTATLTKGDQTIALTVDKLEAIVNGKPVALDVPPKTSNGRMVIPVRFVAEQIGLEVTWDEANQAVRVKEKGKPAAPPKAGASIDPAAFALVEGMEQNGNFRTTGTIDMTIGSAMMSMTMQMEMETYNKGTDEMLMYTTINMFGMEQKSGTALYNGTAWTQDATGEWVSSPVASLPEEDPLSNPANLANMKPEDLEGATITLTQQSYEGVSMQVVTVNMDVMALAEMLGEDTSDLTNAVMTMTYWFNADKTPHHVDILMDITASDEEETTMKMEGTMFYEVWDQPIPFPAEITGAAN